MSIINMKTKIIDIDEPVLIRYNNYFLVVACHKDIPDILEKGIGPFNAQDTKILLATKKMDILVINKDLLIPEGIYQSPN